MSSRQSTLFDGARLQMTDSIKMTIESLAEHGATHRHWVIAWSGGKDSTALLTVAIWLVMSGKVPRPESITILFADTRMEIPPLWIAAQTIRDELAVAGDELAAFGIRLDVQIVMAPLDRRFWVYMLGRGVPPPTNTFRWCTDKLKIDPMKVAMEAVAATLDEKVLLLIGLRLGESAARDDRIAVACSKDDGECGTGLFERTAPTHVCDKLSPILHWRVCHVWEWLRRWAPMAEFGDWSTEIVAEAYGGDDAEDLAARTGCMGCDLVVEDRAMKICSRLPGWDYLGPIAPALKGIYAYLRLPSSRLRQPGGERRKDGKLSVNQQRLGPLKIEVRLEALDRVLALQATASAAAAERGRPPIDLINPEEEARIRELIAAGTWPDKWDGSQPGGEVMLDQEFADGTSQPLLNIFK